MFYGLHRRNLVHIAYPYNYSINIHTSAGGTKDIYFGLSLHLFPCIVLASRDGSDKTAQICLSLPYSPIR